LHGHALNYTENAPATIVDPGVTIKEPTNITSLTKAVVTLNGYVAGEDVINYTP